MNKVEPRAVKRFFFLGYPDEVKGYKLWDPEHSKCIISRDVVSRVGEMYHQTLNAQRNKATSMSGTHLGFEVEAVERRHMKDMEGSEPHQTHETSEHENLRDYQLDRDRKRRKTRKSVRYEDQVEEPGVSETNLIVFAFTMGYKLDDSKPKR